MGNFDGFHHIKFYVGNALQAASYYCTRFGFTHVYSHTLETGNRDSAQHVIRQNKIFFVFVSDLAEKDISRHVSKHGDGVKDVAFTVDDCHAVWKVESF